MNLLTKLPQCVHAQDQEVEIHTDFRNWIEFDHYLHDPHEDQLQNYTQLLKIYKSMPEDITDVNALILPLFEFYAGGKSDEDETQNTTVPERTYDLMEDAPFLYSAFLQSYQMDLQNIEHLHWWKFCALLQSLPEDTLFIKICHWRSADTSKMSKEEKNWYRAQKQKYALKQHQNSKMTLEQRNKMMIEHAQKRLDQAHMA